MYRVTIRALGSGTVDPIATGTGATWEEAAFRGYDRLTRSKGEARRYLAVVEAEPDPDQKIVRFGFRVAGNDGIETDPSVVVDIDRDH